MTAEKKNKILLASNLSFLDTPKENKDGTCSITL
jgi:hypothetical protein